MQLTPLGTICSIYQDEYLPQGCVGTNKHVSERGILLRISENNTLA